MFVLSAFVAGTIVTALDCDARDLVDACAVYVHVPLRRRRVARRLHKSGAPVDIREVRGERPAGDSGSQALDTESEHRVIPARGNRLVRLVKRNRATGTGVLDVDDRDIRDPKALKHTLARPEWLIHRAYEHGIDIIDGSIF
jgi:hypothetical protein